MDSYDITLTITIILLFVFLFLFNIFSIGIKNIKNNWAKYRCTPSVIPFASMFGHDASQNFSYCIQNMQTSFMGYLLEPVNYAMKMANTLGGDIVGSINSIRGIISSVRNHIVGIIQSVFGVFLNILIEFQKITMSIKAMMGKLLGIMTTLLFLLDGTVKTMQSAWNGPPGKLTRALCFHKDTKLKLKNGDFKTIKEINLGDILKNGDIIEGKVEVKNWNNDLDNIKEDFYSLPNGENKEDILVTGKHLIWYNNKWDYVKNHPLAKKTEQSSPFLYCLITNNHHISIGDYIFWDWEDTPEMVKHLN